MAPVDRVIAFVVSLLIGGLGIHVGAILIAGKRDYGHAVVTALIGAAVWALVGILVGDIPLVGAILSLLAYLAVVKWRYKTGWIAAGGIALVAWIAAIVVLYLLARADVTTFDAVGIPGV